MILILGGTTEGRSAVKVADEAATPFYYSTKGTFQAIVTAHGSRLTGALDAEAMEEFCRTHAIRLLVDAAHPFATVLHRTVAKVSKTLGIPVVRYERQYPPRSKDLIWCEDYEDAMRRMEDKGVGRLLALSGVNTIAPLRPFWESHECWFRILEREESLDIAKQQGFPQTHLLFFSENKDQDELRIMREIHPDAILTKESGGSGYFANKVDAARQADIPVFVVKRPVLPETFYRVYGEDGLRKQIERLLPGFFPLRSGYTTGVCATAAAKAALSALLSKSEQAGSLITLPSGEWITLPVVHTEWTDISATCSVIKDAGDDPDVTNHSTIQVNVELVKIPPKKDLNSIREALQAHSDQMLVAAGPVFFRAGKGVGIVTLPGLGLEVGGPAINTTPRKMICDELTPLLPDSTVAIVTISVEGGEELAKRTFNPKLGIVGGISIIGTSGIVRPFSSDAFIASIRKEASVAKAIGCKTLVINSGAKSERYLKGVYPDLPPQSFVHYGNFIGETLKIAVDLDFQRVVLGIMIGKAVKLAEGFLDTHSKKVVMNKAFLQELALQAGCQKESAQVIEGITLARELWDLLPEADQGLFFSSLLQECKSHCATIIQAEKLSLFLITEEGKILYEA